MRKRFDSGICQNREIYCQCEGLGKIERFLVPSTLSAIGAAQEGTKTLGIRGTIKFQVLSLAVICGVTVKR